MQSLVYPESPAIDQQWFDRIYPFAQELYITLGVPGHQLDKLHAQFTDEAFNPDLRPLHLDPIRIASDIRSLELLIDDLRTEPNHAVAKAYTMKSQELITQNKLLVAAILGDDETLSNHNRWLYGSADDDLFAGVCAWLRKKAMVAADSHQGELPKLARHVLSVIPDMHGSISDILPHPDTFRTVRDKHFSASGYYEALLKGIDLDTMPETITPRTGDEITRHIIRNIGSDYQLTDSTDYLWGVIHERNQVVRPTEYRLRKPDFIGIVSHEIGSHLLERENGSRQPLRLLSIGLDRYESSNEGRAFLREQIQFSSEGDMTHQISWEHIILLYLSSALGDGIHHGSYDFKSLYHTILTTLRFLKACRMPDQPEIAGKQAFEEAWQITARACKGTDGNGGSFNKGMVYLGGNLQAWNIASTDPAVIFLGDAGKFDISRRDHRDILRDVGIIG